MSDTLAEALVAFQAKAPQITKGKTVEVKTKSGGRYTFDYATHEVIAEAIRQPLADVGLAVHQMLDCVFDKPAVRTIILHKSGERVEGTFPLLVTDEMSAQEIGSLITYVRRYALVAALGLVTEDDDDGNHASGNTVEKETVKPAPGPLDPNALMSDEKADEVVAYAEAAGFNFWNVARELLGRAEDITNGEAKGVCAEIARRKKAAA